MSIYDFYVKNIDGDEISLEKYKGKIVLIVNVASKCGFTSQYNELQELYEKYKERGFMILAFPCNQFRHQEPKNNQEIKEFCQINFGVTFDMFAKIEVNGQSQSPLYRFLKEQKGGFLGDNIKWNFTKFLVDREGRVVKRYAPMTNPQKIGKDIEQL